MATKNMAIAWSTKMKCCLFWFLFLLNVGFSLAQVSQINGKVLDENARPMVAIVALEGTAFNLFSDANGRFTFTKIPFGQYTLVAMAEGMQTYRLPIEVNKPQHRFDVTLKENITALAEVAIIDLREATQGLSRLNAVDQFGIYEGKKSEVVMVQDLTFNAAANNPRQLYGRITGLNIWESDQAGLQLGIAGRGLSPNRTANFNTRQNGYDISADALGYPESYFTPPAEALDKIEIVRGAASLQYGTQFGGLLNFRYKQGPADQKIELTSRQSLGSWGFFNSFNSVGGTVGKLNYYTYYQYKTGAGYRPNSSFDYHNAYGSFRWQATNRLMVNFDVSWMTYLSQQPGGLTDKMFDENPRQSVRERNWFSVDWNLMALNFSYQINSRTQLNFRNFALMAGRKSLGNLERINVVDFGENRTLIDGNFENWGSETRLIHRFEIAGTSQALLIGTRVYRGQSQARQGDGNNGSGPDFQFLNPTDLENSDYDFPNTNLAMFAEQVIDFHPKLSVTPGIRIEHIQTNAKGYYNLRVFDAAGNEIVRNKVIENSSRTRNFLIAGIGTSYKPTSAFEIYSNFSQNYRAINFTDLRVVNPNFIVDPNIRDEKGFTADLGIRSQSSANLQYEITAFYVAYRGKIGQILKADQPPLFNDIRFRGNISDARNIGVEAYAEWLVSSLWKQTSTAWSWSWFVNGSVIDARYINSTDAAVRNRKVEMVPPVILRTGSLFKYKQWRSAFQYGYTASHFSDATNAQRTATAVEGIISAYGVADLSFSYEFRKFTIENSCNNLFNARYFTRRAEAYPGPGIIPADGRSFYVTLQLKI